MIDELSTKLVSKFGFSGNRLAETIEDWRRRTTEISIRGDLCVVEADPDDDVFVECAVRSGARFIVSGDRHLLKLGEYGATKVITATALLDAV